ncbi:MAG: cytochrome c biogenesis heme-transporting ATPase CcmA [Gammaproteobacteria bacterium]
MLEVFNLAVVRGDRQLFTELEFSANDGELLYVHGPNGSGKTTLLRMLCGLVMPTDGEIHWKGEQISELGEAFRRELFYLGHLNAIKADLTGLENLRIQDKLAGQAISVDKALDALERMGLEGFEDFPTKILSQGQKRRVALARLLLTNAKLWVLDEPFVALDKKTVEALSAIFSEHLTKKGIIVLTTHQEVAIDTATVNQVKLGS